MSNAGRPARNSLIIYIDEQKDFLMQLEKSVKHFFLDSAFGPVCDVTKFTKC